MAFWQLNKETVLLKVLQSKNQQISQGRIWTFASTFKEANINAWFCLLKTSVICLDFKVYYYNFYVNARSSGISDSSLTASQSASHDSNGWALHPDIWQRGFYQNRATMVSLLKWMSSSQDEKPWSLQDLNLLLQNMNHGPVQRSSPCLYVFEYLAMNAW